MAAILNGFLPAKKKDQYSHLNTRWGDAAISAPIHGGWNNSGSPAPSQESPDLERDLPPTPPQHSEDSDGVFILHDGEEESRSVEGQDREDFSPNLSFPAWKRKASHSRKLPQSTSPVLNTKSAATRRTDTMSPLGTAEAAATLPSPDSRVSSPVARTTTTPVLSFRSRFANPNIADMLSPVAEGFAKDGPTTRPAPIMSTMEDEDESTEQPSNTSSLRSNMPRRASNTAYITAAYNSEGLGGMTMSSQAATDEQLPEFNRPQSRGIATTAHMRASSRGPRASSRGQRSTSIEPATQRSGSVEPNTRRAPSVEAYNRRAPSVEAVARRAPSIEPVARRAPSTERPARRAPSIEPYPQRAPSIEPVFRRTPPMDSIAQGSTYIEPHSRRAPSIEPIATRGQSVGQYSHRGHSVEPYARRAPSIEPVARRGQSVDQYSSRGHSVEPSTHRAPSIQPSRGQSVDQYSRRGHSVEPFINRGQSIEPVYHQERVESRPVIPTVSDLQPLRRRAPSIEPTRRRAPSIDPGARRGFSLEPAPPGRRVVESSTGRAPSLGPPGAAQRAQSREPRGRRGASVEPNPHLRFHSEVAHRTHRRDSISSNDGSLDPDSDNEDFDAEHFSPPSRIDPDFTSTHKLRRRRSIASPITSPNLASFAIPRQNHGPPQPAPLTTTFDSITSRTGLTQRPIITPIDKNPSSRNHSQTRTRGLYADLQDDFSMLAREVQSSVLRDASMEPPLASLIPQLPRTVFEPPPLITQLPRNVLNSSQRTAPPIVGAHPPIYQAGIGTLVTRQWDLDRTGTGTGNTNTAGYSSNFSQPSQSTTSTSTSTSGSTSNTNTISSSTDRPHQSIPTTIASDPPIPHAILSNLTRDRHDQFRRDERERAREKVTARLEAQRERERALAANTQNVGSSESNGTGSSGGGSGSDRTRRVYGSNTSTADDGEQDLGVGKRGLGFEKELVPSDEVIWG